MKEQPKFLLLFSAHPVYKFAKQPVKRKYHKGMAFFPIPMHNNGST